MTDSDIVTFLLPDGTEVSNDPRFMTQRQVNQALVDQRPNIGHENATNADVTAATGAGQLSLLQSGQPGVGEGSHYKNPAEIRSDIPGRDGIDAQTEDAKTASEAKLNPAKTAGKPAPVLDANEAVLAQREAAADANADLPTGAGGTAKDQVDDEPEPGLPVSQWSPPQLKREAKRLGVEVVKGMKKSELVAALEAKQQEAAGGSSSES